MRQIVPRSRRSDSFSSFTANVSHVETRFARSRAFSTAGRSNAETVFEPEIVRSVNRNEFDAIASMTRQTEHVSGDRRNVVADDTARRWKTNGIATMTMTRLGSARGDYSSFCRAASGPCRSHDLRAIARSSARTERAKGEREREREPAPLMIVMGTLRYTYVRVYETKGPHRLAGARSSREWNKVMAILIVVSWAIARYCRADSASPSRAKESRLMLQDCRFIDSREP